MEQSPRSWQSEASQLFPGRLLGIHINYGVYVVLQGSSKPAQSQELCYRSRAYGTIPFSHWASMHGRALLSDLITTSRASSLNSLNLILIFSNYCNINPANISMHCQSNHFPGPQVIQSPPHFSVLALSHYHFLQQLLSVFLNYSKIP